MLLSASKQTPPAAQSASVAQLAPTLPLPIRAAAPHSQAPNAPSAPQAPTPLHRRSNRHSRVAPSTQGPSSGVMAPASPAPAASPPVPASGSASLPLPLLPPTAA